MQPHQISRLPRKWKAKPTWHPAQPRWCWKQKQPDCKAGHSDAWRNFTKYCTCHEEWHSHHVLCLLRYLHFVAMDAAVPIWLAKKKPQHHTSKVLTKNENLRKANKRYCRHMIIHWHVTFTIGTAKSSWSRTAADGKQTSSKHISTPRPIKIHEKPLLRNRKKQRKLRSQPSNHGSNFLAQWSECTKTWLHCCLDSSPRRGPPKFWTPKSPPAHCFW